MYQDPLDATSYCSHYGMPKNVKVRLLGRAFCWLLEMSSLKPTASLNCPLKKKSKLSNPYNLES